MTMPEEEKPCPPGMIREHTQTFNRRSWIFMEFQSWREGTAGGTGQKTSSTPIGLTQMLKPELGAPKEASLVAESPKARARGRRISHVPLR